MTDIPIDTKPLSLDERRALSWYRENGPADVYKPNAPDRRLRIALVARGLIQISPSRKRLDPISYEITARGEEVLRGY